MFLSSHKFLVESTSEEKLNSTESVPKMNGMRKVPDEENVSLFSLKDLYMDKSIFIFPRIFLVFFLIIKNILRNENIKYNFI